MSQSPGITGSAGTGPSPARAPRGDRHGLRRVARPARAALVALVLLGAGCTARGPAADPHQPVASHSTSIRTASPFAQGLERLGVPLDLPAQGKAIIVNIPAFELIAIRDGVPELRSRVIVGSPRNPTPVLATHVSAVRFRPRWRPTPAMVASGEYEDRVWPPGRKNPLGLAAIRLGEGLLVYLHDTNRRSLFEREARALSHGCIRVQRWDELSAWVLDIPLDEVRRHANGRRTFDMPSDPIPVFLGYFLNFPDDSGAAQGFADVYGLGRSVGPAVRTDAADATCAGG